jgi:hypothetical protein
MVVRISMMIQTDIINARKAISGRTDSGSISIFILPELVYEMYCTTDYCYPKGNNKSD